MNKTFTLEEAKKLAQQGVKVRHKYFTNGEYLIMENDTIIFEDGIKILFDSWIEKGKFNTDWSIVDTFKIVKISDNHYVIINNDKIKIYDFCLNIDRKIFQQKPHLPISIDSRKITHSTLTEDTEEMLICGVKVISLEKIEEAIYGYSVDEMATNLCLAAFPRHDDNSFDEAISLCKDFYVYGFKAHKELTKDKLFTIEDVRKELTILALEIATEDGKLTSCSPSLIYSWIEDKIQSLLPKTTWNVCFGKDNKIILI